MLTLEKTASSHCLNEKPVSANKEEEEALNAASQVAIDALTAPALGIDDKGLCRREIKVLLHAVNHGDSKTVRSSLEQYPHFKKLLSVQRVRFPDLFNRAVSRGHVGVAEVLIEKGVDPKVFDGYESPIEAVINYGVKKVEMIKWLVEKGVDPNPKEESFLMTAISRIENAGKDENGNEAFEVIRCLIEAGVPPNVPSELGHTSSPLARIAKREHINPVEVRKIVKFMLERGAKLKEGGRAERELSEAMRQFIKDNTPCGEEKKAPEETEGVKESGVKEPGVKEPKGTKKKDKSSYFNFSEGFKPLE